MPARACQKAKTIACGLRRTDAPACRRGARLQRLRGTQQEKRQARFAGGKLQPLTHFQIEPVDEAGDGKRRRRTQGFGQRPQRVLALGGLDQDEAQGVETEAAQAIAMQAAMPAPAMGREDKNHGGRGRKCDPGQQRRDKSESGRDRAFRLGHDFMQRGGGKAARQMGIDGRKAEGQGPAMFGTSRQKAAQIPHLLGTPVRRRKGLFINHLTVSGRRHRLSIFAVCFQPATLEQNKNNAKRVPSAAA
jgi:hypothetical protein